MAIFRRSILIGTLVFLTTCWSAQKDSSKKQAFDLVLELDRQAADARAAEKEAEVKRQEAYRQAAGAVRKFIDKWEPSPTVENLRERFRLGIYLELSGDPKSASEQYKLCANHPKLLDRGANWNNQRIADLIDYRIRATAPPVQSGGGGGGGGAGGTCGTTMSGHGTASGGSLSGGGVPFP